MNKTNISAEPMLLLSPPVSSQLLIIPSATRETGKDRPNMGFDFKYRAKRTIFSVS
jgi:hypothetical protein